MMSKTSKTTHPVQEQKGSDFSIISPDLLNLSTNIFVKKTLKHPISIPLFHLLAVSTRIIKLKNTERERKAKD